MICKFAHGDKIGDRKCVIGSKSIDMYVYWVYCDGTEDDRKNCPFWNKGDAKK